MPHTFDLFAALARLRCLVCVNWKSTTSMTVTMMEETATCRTVVSEGLWNHVIFVPSCFNRFDLSFQLRLSTAPKQTTSEGPRMCSADAAYDFTIQFMEGGGVFSGGIWPSFTDSLNQILTVRMDVDGLARRGTLAC